MWNVDIPEIVNIVKEQVEDFLVDWIFHDKLGSV